MKSIRFLVAALAVGFAAPAFAQQDGAFQAAVDLHPVIPLSDGAGEGVGFGFDVRPGYAMKMEGFSLVPEAVIGWNSFATGSDLASASLFRILGGARAVFGEGQVLPAAYAHVGFGSYSASVEIPPLFPGMQTVTVDASTSTAIVELGGALDYALNQNFTLGAHAGLNFMTASGAGSYLTLGAQAGYRF